MCTKPELTGDQVDLGGFGQFVHNQDPDRTIRLRFELNLNAWRVPEPVLKPITDAQREANQEAHDHDADDVWAEPWTMLSGYHAAEDIDIDPASITETGWLEVSACFNKFSLEPQVAGYAVGINGLLVGRIHRNDNSDISLAYNPDHPLFDEVLEPSEVVPEASATQLPEAQTSDRAGLPLAHAALKGELTTPLPDWDKLLRVDDGDLKSVRLPDCFEFLITGVLTGVGFTLKEELAKLRHLGPLRTQRPRVEIRHVTRRQRRWSDGSGAWDLLTSHSPDAANTTSDLLLRVNEWLSGSDRLASAYKLRRRSTIEIPADGPFVHKLQQYRKLIDEFKGADDHIDVAAWVQKRADQVVLASAVECLESKIPEWERLQSMNPSGIGALLLKKNP